MKMILVSLADDVGGRGLLDTAFAIARRFNAHVDGLHVRPDPAEALHATSMAFPGALRDQVLEVGRRQAEEAATRVRTLFQDYCAENDITLLDRPPAAEGVSAAWHEETGKESLVVALRGRLTDLTVVRRPLEASPAPDTLESALMETGKPVLILPLKDDGGARQSVGRRVAIGWNGSTVAAKAVAAARHFLITAEKVTALSLQEEKDQHLSVADLIDHLAWHGVEADTRRFEARSSHVGEALLNEARALDADLLVLGGYGTSMTRELILGGVTRTMLAHAEIPLLMVH